MTEDEIENGWARMILSVRPTPELDQFLSDVKRAVAELEAEQRRDPNLLSHAILMATPTEIRIRSLLLKKPGLTQAELSRHLGVTKMAVLRKLKNNRLFYHKGHYPKRYFAVGPLVKENASP